MQVEHASNVVRKVTCRVNALAVVVVQVQRSSTTNWLAGGFVGFGSSSGGWFGGESNGKCWECICH